MTNKTIERQSAAKAVAEIFHGQGPLTEEEEEQYKRLTEEVAEFNKRGRFTGSESTEQEQETQKLEIEVSTDNTENPEEDTEEEDEEE